jgi:hypothetical protein
MPPTLTPCVLYRQPLRFYAGVCVPERKGPALLLVLHAHPTGQLIQLSAYSPPSSSIPAAYSVCTQSILLHQLLLRLRGPWCGPEQGRWGVSGLRQVSGCLLAS